MWAPFCHDWEALRERKSLKQKLEDDKSATISIEVPIKTFLKLAEQADCSSKGFGNFGYQFNDIYDVESYINEILDQKVMESELQEMDESTKNEAGIILKSTEVKSKVLSKTK